jgi:pimeloyl-ACP methyl ester carboxylesterase
MSTSLPAASLLLVHGAGSGPWVFQDWKETFPRLLVAAVDLQENLDPARAAMDDYAQNVIASARRLPQPVLLCGWSMGGLVALQAAAAIHPHMVVLLEASAPAEVQGFHPNVELTEGTFDPEVEYGRFPPGVPARAESLLARAGRKQGISVPSLACPSLVVYGQDFPEERGRALASLYGSRELEFPDLHHFDLVLDPRVREEIARLLGFTPSL